MVVTLRRSPTTTITKQAITAAITTSAVCSQLEPENISVSMFGWVGVAVGLWEGKFGLGSTNPDPGGWSIWIGNITKSGKVDVQVLGINGFYTKLIDNPPCWRIPQYSVFNETGRSAWSTTQTITIPFS